MSPRADMSSRLYTDLIWRVSTRYGNWWPNQQMKVGDYGKVNHETAEFEKDGSIYEDDFMPDLMIKKNHDVQPEQQEDELVVVSKQGKTQDFDADFAAAWPNIVASRIKGRWSFSRSRGAVLILYKPVEKTIKGRSLLLPKLTDKLKDYVLVTSVYECRMYALILTQKEKQLSDVAVGLKLLENGGEGLHGNWEHFSSSGMWRCGGEEGGSIFYPLYSLSQPKAQESRGKWFSFFRGPKVHDEDDGFEVYQPPWSVLNEDGDEISTSDEEAQEGDGNAARELN